MSQVALTNEERNKALQSFGYTERESAFLCLAALHGGYFLRRQYDHFVGRQDGGSTAQLIERVLAKRHAQAFSYRHNTHVYHLCTRPFYAALGQVDNRNRRPRQASTIKNKLMGLDFVLAHWDHEYLATEQEKLDYFTGTLHLPISTLPSKLFLGGAVSATTARYFVDKYPIFLVAPATAGAEAVISFCFVDEGLVTVSRFETYLAQYAPLFRSLRRFHLIFVAASRRLFEPAQSRFERMLIQGQSSLMNSAADPKIRRLLEYFAIRRLYETKQLAGFDRAKLIRLRNDRETFSGAENEALYERWKTAGDRAVLEDFAPDRIGATQACATFSTYLLEHDYDIFGSLTAF